MKKSINITVPGGLTRLLACSLLAANFASARAELKILDPSATQYGRTQGEWGGAWWQWASGLPAEGNPTADKTGQDAAKGQSGNVWFLAGSTSSASVTRDVSIPQGKGIFFPILNTIWISTEPSDPTDLSGILATIEPMNPTAMSCELDGVPIREIESTCYGRSSLFNVTLPENNLFGIGAGNYGPSAAVGYYVMLAPPSPGLHTIHFTGNIERFNLSLDVTYRITVEPQAPDLSRLVVIGDSLLAGYRDGGLVDRYQAGSIPAVVARQAAVGMSQPLIGWPGIRPVLELKRAGFPPVIAPTDGVSTGRVDVTVIPQNLAVPGHTVRDTLLTRPDVPIDSMTDLVLGIPALFQGVARTQVEWAEAMRPSAVLVWIGNNDALNAAIVGDPKALTPAEDFRRQYTELIDRLAATGARLVVANIPDVGSIPYLLPARFLAAALGVPEPVFQAVLGVGMDDLINLDGIGDLAAIFGQQKAGPLDGGYVLTPAEIAAIRSATAGYNAVIAEQARAKGAILVDMESFLKRLVAEGAQTGNTHITANYMGGIFSLDGIHPTEAGAALCANEFIAAMNGAGSRIPPVVWLARQRRDNGLALSWPDTAPGYSLQTSSLLAPGSWTAVNAVAQSVGAMKEVVLPAAQANRFFRLVATTAPSPAAAWNPALALGGATGAPAIRASARPQPSTARFGSVSGLPLPQISAPGVSNSK